MKVLNLEFIREVGVIKWMLRVAVRQYYKRVARRAHQMTLPTGRMMQLPLADRFATEAFVTDANVDWGSEKLLFSVLSGQGVLLDIGAHIGYYSLYMLPKVSAVFAFEPDPRVSRLLEANVADCPEISVINSAVGSQNGKARFALEEDSEVSHLVGLGEAGSQQIVVDITTVDSFVASRGLWVDAIKIDVEGHDFEVIRGASAVLRSQAPIVLTEASLTDELIAFTRALQYRIFAFARESVSRKRVFAELTRSDAVPGVTKMLFLVPPRLHRQFLPLVSANGGPF